MGNYTDRRRFASAQGVQDGLHVDHGAIIEEVLAAALPGPSHETGNIYLSLAGVLDPPPEPLGSSFCSREAMAIALGGIIHGILHDTPSWHIGIADIRHPGWHSDIRPAAFVRAASKWAKASLPRLGAGAFVGVKTTLPPSADRQEGFVVETRLRALIFSTDRERTEREKAKLERRPLDEKPTIGWNWIRKPNDRLLAAAASTLLSADDPGGREALYAARDLEIDGWHERASERSRYRFLMLARCPLAKLFFGIGFAQHRARALVNDAKYAAKQRARLNPSLIQADEVSCFAWDEAVRLGELGLRLPHIDLR